MVLFYSFFFFVWVWGYTYKFILEFRNDASSLCKKKFDKNCKEELKLNFLNLLMNLFLLPFENKVEWVKMLGFISPDTVNSLQSNEDFRLKIQIHNKWKKNPSIQSNTKFFFTVSPWDPSSYLEILQNKNTDNLLSDHKSLQRIVKSEKKLVTPGLYKRIGYWRNVYKNT